MFMRRATGIVLNIKTEFESDISKRILRDIFNKSSLQLVSRIWLYLQTILKVVPGF